MELRDDGVKEGMRGVVEIGGCHFIFTSSCGLGEGLGEGIWGLCIVWAALRGFKFGGGWIREGS